MLQIQLDGTAAFMFVFSMSTVLALQEVKNKSRNHPGYVYLSISLLARENESEVIQRSTGKQ